MINMPITSMINPRFRQERFFFSPTKYPIIRGKLKRISAPPNIAMFYTPFFVLIVCL